MTQQEIINGIKLSGTLLDKRKKNITPLVETKIKTMYSNNIKKTKIARELGVSLKTVDRVLDPKVRERDRLVALKCTKARQKSLSKDIMYERRKRNHEKHLSYKIELLNIKLNTMEV